MRTWLISLALNALVTMAGTRGIQNGPKLELVQIPLERTTTRAHQPSSHKEYLLPSPLPSEVCLSLARKASAATGKGARVLQLIALR